MFRSVMSKTARLLAKLPQEPRLKLVHVKELSTLNSGGFNQKSAPFTSVYDFLQITLLRLGFRSDEEVTVFDTGCGSGVLTKEFIMPMYPNMKRAFAIDPLPHMVKYAEEHYPHPRLEYNVGFIGDWNSVMVWDGCITKLFAIYSLQWVEDQPQAFRNIHQLLHPGGEAAIYMILHSMFYTAMEKMISNKKWAKYFEDVGEYRAVSHKNGYHSDYYRQLAEGLGFTIVHCREQVKSDSLPTDMMYRNFFASICVLLDFVPSTRREEFKDDLFVCMLREGGRTTEGRPMHIGTMLELVIRKER